MSQITETVASLARQRPCKASKWLIEQSVSDQEEWQVVVEANPLHTTYRAAKSLGFDGSPTAWSRHFTRMCGCYHK